MQLQLSQHEAHLLRQVLESYLRELRGEIVDTDNPGYRRDLRDERDALASIMDRLEQDPSASPTAITKMVRVTAVLTEYD
jgi:hypothetical protein